MEVHPIMVTTDRAMFVLLRAMVKVSRRDLKSALHRNEAADFLWGLLEWCGHTDPDAGLRTAMQAGSGQRKISHD